MQDIAEYAFKPVKSLCGGVMFEAELYDVILENESENGTPPAIISEKLVDIS